MEKNFEYYWNYVVVFIAGIAFALILSYFTLTCVPR